MSADLATMGVHCSMTWVPFIVDGGLQHAALSWALTQYLSLLKSGLSSIPNEVRAAGNMCRQLTVPADKADCRVCRLCTYHQASRLFNQSCDMHAQLFDSLHNRTCAGPCISMRSITDVLHTAFDCGICFQLRRISWGTTTFRVILCITFAERLNVVLAACRHRSSVSQGLVIFILWTAFAMLNETLIRLDVPTICRRIACFCERV